MTVEMEQVAILRHVEVDMDEALKWFKKDNVYEVMLNPYRREDGRYEGHIWYEQAGVGMVRAMNETRLPLSRYSSPNIGDVVVYKYAEQDGEQIILNYHDAPTNRQELLEAMNMVLKNTIKTDSDGQDYLDQDENFKLNVLADNVNAGLYAFKEPIPDDVELDSIVKQVNQKLSRIIGVAAKIAIVNIQSVNDLALFKREPRYARVKEFVKMERMKALQIMSILAGANELHTHKKEAVLECAVPFYNHRFTGQRMPIVQFPAFTIRRHGSEVMDLDDYVRDGIMPQSVAVTIREWITHGFNILIAGGTASGKTTLLNSIIRETARIFPDGQGRAVIIEDTPEIQCEIENSVLMHKSNEVSIDDLLVTALRMRPNFIMVGEIRSREAYTLFKAMLTGHKNCYGTIHANGAYEATFRFEQCVKEHPECAGTIVPRAQIALAVNGVISIQKTTVRVERDGYVENVIKRKVTALRQIRGYDPKHDLYEDIMLYQDKEAVIEEIKPVGSGFGKYQ